jgi:hypothetical protein
MRYEKDLSAFQKKKSEQARIQGSYGDSQRPKGFGFPQGKRKEKTNCI